MERITFSIFFILIHCLDHCSVAVASEEFDFIRSGDNLQKLAQRNYKKVSFKYKELSDYAEDLKKWNYFIDDWSQIRERQYVYVDYPYSPYSISEWTEPLAQKKIPTDYSFQASFLYKVIKIDQEQYVYNLSSLKYVPFSFNGSFQVNNFPHMMKLVFGFAWDYSINQKVSSANNLIQNDISKNNEFELRSYVVRKMESLDSSFIFGVELDQIQSYNFSTSNSET